MTQLRIPAVYMRGGTSKGVFFRDDVLPTKPEQRARLLLRVIGSPDPYGKQIDGMGAATSSTSKGSDASPGCLTRRTIASSSGNPTARSSAAPSCGQPKSQAR